MLGLRSHTQGFQRLASPPLCGLQAAALALTWVIPAPALSFFLFIPTGPNIGVSEGIRTLLLTGPGALSAPAPRPQWRKLYQGYSHPGGEWSGVHS